MNFTKYKKGSILELWAIAFPLMISSLSVMAMLFVDRLMLAKFSTEALNAAVSASTLGWAFIIGTMVMAGISEVFVAQYNGAKNYKAIGAPVWQMLWFSVLTCILFIPIALFGGNFFFTGDRALHIEYFSWMLGFGWVYAFYAALSGFFIGRGKTLIITLLAIGANFVNILLDWLFIFGIEGYFPTLGVKGAAIATSLSALFQALVLFCLFLKRQNRENFGTGEWKWNFKIFKDCFRVGGPCASFVLIEVSAWASYYGLMTWAGSDYITVVGICQSFLILLFFFSEGVQKAVSALAGNYIGAKEPDVVPKVAFSALKLHFGFFVFSLGLFFFFSDTLLQQFLPDEAVRKSLQEPLSACMLLMLVYLFFEGVRLSFYGALTSAGDTLFLSVIGALSIWVFLVLPIWFFVVEQKGSVVLGNWICVLYSIAACLIYSGRFLQGKWREFSLHQTH